MGRSKIKLRAIVWIESDYLPLNQPSSSLAEQIEFLPNKLELNIMSFTEQNHLISELMVKKFSLVPMNFSEFICLLIEIATQFYWAILLTCQKEKKKKERVLVELTFSLFLYLELIKTGFWSSSTEREFLLIKSKQSAIASE